MLSARRIIFIFSLLAGVIFILKVLTNLQVDIPIMPSEPKIIPAAIVEGLIGIFFLVSAYGIYKTRPWAWRGAMFAHLFAIAGILLGMISLALEAGPRTKSNDIYHIIALALIIIDLLLILSDSGKAALRRGLLL